MLVVLVLAIPTGRDGWADVLLKRVTFSDAQGLAAHGITRLAALDLPARTEQLEDVLWFTATSTERPEGPAQPAVLLRFAEGGPALRVLRVGGRPELRLELKRDQQWIDTGARLALGRRWRLRAQLTLAENEITLLLKDLQSGAEFAAGSFANVPRLPTFSIVREVELPAAAGFAITILRWEIWRRADAELVPQEKLPGAVSTRSFRPVGALTTSESACVSRESSGRTVLTLSPAPGLREDMELIGETGFLPVDRVMRLTGNACSGHYFLGLSQAPGAVERIVDMPDGDLVVEMAFRLPATVPLDRHIYLVRFRDPGSGADPVGPALYLDYGAGQDSSNFIFQLNPDHYLSRPMKIEPDRWYRLRLEVNRAARNYVAFAGPADGTLQPLNADQPADFFLQTDVPSRTQWRFFSERTWRSTITDFPALTPEPVPIWRHVPAREEELTPLVLRGLKTLPEDARWDSEELHRNVDAFEVIRRDVPTAAITPEVLPKLGPYRMLMLDGKLHLPGALDLRYSFLVRTNGRVWLYLNDTVAKFQSPRPEDASKWHKWTFEKPVTEPETEQFRLVYLPPDDATEPLCELRWQLATARPEPVPHEVFTGAAHDLAWDSWRPQLADMTCYKGELYAVRTHGGLVRLRIRPDRLVLETPAEAVTPNNWLKPLGAGSCEAIAWDEKEDGFWLSSIDSRRLILTKPSLTETRSITRDWRRFTRSLAASDRWLYLTTDERKLVRAGKFGGEGREIELSKMFGGPVKIGAVAVMGMRLLVGTTEDSSWPGRVFCIDPDVGNVFYAVDLSGMTQGVHALATDGRYVYACGKDSAIVRFPVPDDHQLELAGRFLELDDLVVRAREATGSASGTSSSQAQVCSGSLVSSVMECPFETGLLRWASWREIPFDRARGTLELSVRSTSDRFELDQLPWQTVLEQREVNLPVQRFFQYRVRITTTDPWRPPGMHDLVFGFDRRVDSPKLPLGRIVAVAAAVPVLAFLVWLIGRPTLWSRRGAR